MNISVVSGTYDKSTPDDAGKYQADRSGYRTGGCQSTYVAAGIRTLMIWQKEKQD